ncbi:hypothetical protein [Saccharothrix sp.]|uniref:hypothetical protein n=1 Tax=Saccharothrix sp. TaxID=1873460 RepID=UPI0028128E93|nr:hypothetical protein [Saccharothrix sp.]
MSSDLRARWRHGDGRLWLQLGHRVDEVPQAITDRLLRDFVTLTLDPGADLLRLEAAMRRSVALGIDRVDDAERRMATARRGGRHDDLALATDDHLTAVTVVQNDQVDLQRLREWITALDVARGPLHDAAAGWKRSPEVPAQVLVVNEDEFLAVDPRRATTTRVGVPAIDGVEAFGSQWRRDGDDDDLAAGPEIDRCGRWALGHIARTGEIYAVLRAGPETARIWLLGTGFERHRAYSILEALMPRMREPNSVILAAEVVHTVNLRHTRPPLALLRRPSPLDEDGARLARNHRSPSGERA